MFGNWTEQIPINHYELGEFVVFFLNFNFICFVNEEIIYEHFASCHFLSIFTIQFYLRLDFTFQFESFSSSMILSWILSGSYLPESPTK